MKPSPQPMRHMMAPLDNYELMNNEWDTLKNLIVFPQSEHDRIPHNKETITLS